MKPDCRDTEFGTLSLTELLDSREDVMFLPERLLDAYKIERTGKLKDYVLLEGQQGSLRKVVGYILRPYAFDVLGYLADHVEDLIGSNALPEPLHDRARQFIKGVWELEQEHYDEDED